MIKITFPDSNVREYPEGVTGYEIAKSLSSRLAKEIYSITVNTEVQDITRPINADASIKLNKWENEEGKDAFWHSSAHIMAEALEAIFPGVKLGIGPTIDNGFYYDIDTGAGGDNHAVSVTTMSSTYIVVGYSDSNDNDFNYYRVDYTGSGFSEGSQRQVDSNMNPAAEADMNDLCAYADNRVANIWFDDGSNYVSSIITDGDANTYAALNLDTSAGEDAIATVACAFTRNFSQLFL